MRRERSPWGGVVVGMGVVVVAWSVSLPVAAQSQVDVPKASKVEIKLDRPSGSPGDPVELVIGPRGVGACNGPGGKGCDQAIEFSTAKDANHGPTGGEYLLVEMGSGLAKGGASVPALDCFPDEEFVLTEQAVTHSLQVKSGCPSPAVWFYTVTLCTEKTAGDGMTAANCSVQGGPVDPGVIIDKPRG